MDYLHSSLDIVYLKTGQAQSDNAKFKLKFKLLIHMSVLVVRQCQIIA